MDIAIIGAGNVGRALASSITRAGHAVTISATNPAHARAVATATGAQPASSNREAMQGAQAVVLAIPTPALEQVLAEEGDALAGRIVIDATNRVDPTNPGKMIDGSSNAEYIQQRIPEARVVKAFNTALAARMDEPTIDGMQLDGYVASDDEAAKAQVLALVGAIGFRPIDVGQLSMARALEAMALLNITIQLQHNLPWEAGFRLVGPMGRSFAE
jgi:predicted dinucleotide-binding enzyme